jgi:signal transduction histidine kinase/ActR/RegA family two-component response regulator
MAGKSRDQRRKRAPNKQAAKRKSAAKVSKVHKRAPAPGVVEAALAAFAHEVRTPLTGILAISDLLATSELGERERRWVETIKAGAEHLASLANLFVDAAKDRETSRKSDRAMPNGLREDLFNLKALAHGAGDSLAGRAAAKGLQAEVEISDALPALVVGDAIRLRAALENLIDNAVKFTEAGGVALVATPVKGAAGKKGGKGRVRVAFAVSDSGIGLSLNEIKRLFRPFSQANVSIASRFGGAGLGLSSVKQIARMMGGDIVVAPRRSGGTTFTLTVALESADATRGAGSAGEALASAPIPPLRILGVEDNPFGRVVLNTILSELGHQAEFIGRGEAAIERIEQGSFDAVLMDMVLPGIDGVEAIRRIRELGPPLGRIAIIGVSGRGDDEAASRAAGADAFLLKPVSPRALATALLEATRRVAAAT